MLAVSALCAFALGSLVAAALLLEKARLEHAAAGTAGMAYCIAGLYGRLDTSYLAEWTAYQRALGVGHVFAYYVEGVTDPATLAWMRERSGWDLLEATTGCPPANPERPLSYELGRLPDCEQKAGIRACYAEVRRRKIRWAMVGDVDEWFAAGPGTDTGGRGFRLADLAASVGDDVSHVSFGVHDVSQAFCVSGGAAGGGGGGGGFADLFRYVRRAPHCHRGYCLGWRGKRKSMIRPALTACCGLHTWYPLLRGFYHVANLHTDFARLHELRGAPARNATAARLGCSRDAAAARAAGYAADDWKARTLGRIADGAASGAAGAAGGAAGAAGAARRPLRLAYPCSRAMPLGHDGPWDKGDDIVSWILNPLFGGLRFYCQDDDV